MKSTVTFEIGDNLAGIRVAVTVVHEEGATESEIQAIASKLLRYRITNLESYNQINGSSALSVEPV